MVYKFIILIFFLNLEIAYSSIVYDKNDISITEIELNSYLDLYQTNFGTSLSNTQAIKNIFIMKKTISFLMKNNPEFMMELDKIIELEFNEKVLTDEIILNFIRFQKIKNEFINDYYKNNFKINDLEIIFSNLKNLLIPISLNDCLTIEKLHDVKDNKYFILSFFENLKTNQQNYQINIDNQIFDACMDKDLFNYIELEIIDYIDNKTEKDFNNFIYGKSN